MSHIPLVTASMRRYIQCEDSSKDFLMLFKKLNIPYLGFEDMTNLDKIIEASLLHEYYTFDTNTIEIA